MYTRIYIPVLNSITSVGMSTKDHNLNNKSQRPRKTHKANNRQGQSSHSDLSIERRTQCKYSMKCLNISVKIETNPAILKAQRALCLNVQPQGETPVSYLDQRQT